MIKLTRKLFHILLLIFSFLFSISMSMSAQGNGTEIISDDDVNAIAKQLYCPVCENIPLDVCGTQACIQWRDLIREKLAAGWSEKDIKDYFVLQYGDRVLAEPPRRGLNLLVYLVPPLAFLVGVFILYRGIQSWRVTKETDEEKEFQEEPLLEDYIDRLEDELKRVK